jgi:hypothetical protein
VSPTWVTVTVVTPVILQGGSPNPVYVADIGSQVNEDGVLIVQPAVPNAMDKEGCPSTHWRFASPKKLQNQTPSVLVPVPLTGAPEAKLIVSSRIAVLGIGQSAEHGIPLPPPHPHPLAQGVNMMPITRSDSLPSATRRCR